MKKSPMKNMAYWKARNTTPVKQVVENPNQPTDPNKRLDPNATIQERVDAKIEEKVDEVVNNKSSEGLNV